MVLAGMNVLTDIILLCAPLPTLWGLQMARAMRLQLIGIFCIGGLYVAFSSYYFKTTMRPSRVSDTNGI